MSFIPEFMKKFPIYSVEKDKIRSLEDWLVFRNKWFDVENWPKKTKKQYEKESVEFEDFISSDGRNWWSKKYFYDIDKEARYEFETTNHDIGYLYMFPDSVNQDKTEKDGWMQECPYCGIVTNEIGNEFCPKCSRKTIFIYAGD